LVKKVLESHNRKKTAARVEFGKLVKNKRIELGLTQEALAERAHLHHTYVGSVERGERNIAFANIIALARALKVSPKELMPAGEKVLKQHSQHNISEKKAFGNLLKSKRLELGLTQLELAERAHMDCSYIGAIERGEKNIGLENIISLATSLELTPQDLMPD
jgi:transcriptional regulator with XRE-family HTH domain